ncbi:MAG TPA: SH3 domain-containing protein [Acidobacteriaceae bacterium]|jgi:hypothetical protein|nr:SH3 domain-containing protein [Acidobacteriaceae bacterium]
MKNSVFLLLAGCLCVAASGQEASITHNSNLRSSPSSGSKVVGHLAEGSAVTILSKYPNQGYVRVQSADDTTGWVWGKNLGEAEAPSSGPGSPAGLAARVAPGARAGDVHIYPNTQETPGKGDPSVTQSNIAKNICNKNWSTDSVRPSDSVTNKIKTETMKAYGFTDAANHYELDHLVSLQNGGCPDCVENLWPEAYGDPQHPMTQDQRAAWNKKNPGSSAILPGSLEKDVVENHVHDEICRDVRNAKMSTYAKKYPATVTVTLERGQEILATDWYGCYQKMMSGNQPCA